MIDIWSKDTHTHTYTRFTCGKSIILVLSLASIRLSETVTSISPTLHLLSTSVCVCKCCSAVVSHYIAPPIKDFRLSDAIRGMRNGEKVVEGKREKKKKDGAGREWFV